MTIPTPNALSIGHRAGTGRKLFCALLLGLLSLSFFLVDQEAGTASQDLPPGSTNTVAHNLQAGPKDKPAEQVYKNIQVFKGLTAAQVDGAMSFMAASLGVGCTHCHAGPWESDDNPAKESARRMVEMMRGINKQSYASNTVVTCYTCHRGQPDPPSSPDTPLQMRPSPTETAAGSRPPLPTADAVIERYYSAIGGRENIARLKTLVSIGTETTLDGVAPAQTASIRLYQKEPDKAMADLQVSEGNYRYSMTGRSGWVKDKQGVRQLSIDDIANIKGEPDFWHYLRLAERYPSLRILGREPIRNRETYVAGATSIEGSRDKLYFDVATGLLLRKLVMFKTVLGSIPEVTDFEDYKQVSGIRLPFAVTWSRPPLFKTRKFKEIQVNAAVSDSKFDPPAK